MGAAAAVILMKERQIIEAFERARSLSPAQSVIPEDIGVDQFGVGWRRLRSRAVIREADVDSGRFYLDVEVWQALRRTRHRMLAVLLVAVAIAAAAVGTGAFTR